MPRELKIYREISLTQYKTVSIENDAEITSLASNLDDETGWEDETVTIDSYGKVRDDGEHEPLG